MRLDDRDRQVKKLWKLLAKGTPLETAAAKCGMDEKTARKYRDAGQLPSELAKPHDWRTREDPFEDVWPEVFQQLEQEPNLEATTLFEDLRDKYPEKKFQDGQLRTFQRGIKRWKATEGPAKEVFFGQIHHPGRLGASDFSHMDELNVTINGRPFDHMVYHFVLTYSNWETVTICFSESFESLRDGMQDALWKLGGVPQRHRTDRLSAAVNNLSDTKEFTKRYEELLDHYGLEREKTQAGKGNENGDVESLHGHFKSAVDQALMLRGSRDFASRGEYAAFLDELIARKNAGRTKRLAEERAMLKPLPGRPHDGRRRVTVKVTTGSLIHVDRNVYSVDSRLIGERVTVWINAETLDVWHGQKLIERLPRLRGRGKRRVNYRHVIDSLARKPGAFDNYRHREELFPSSQFRFAYDAFRDTTPAKADRHYLQLLLLAKDEGESTVERALRTLDAQGAALTVESVREFIQTKASPKPITDVDVGPVDLRSFDSLFACKEVCDEPQGECEGPTRRPTQGTAPTGLS